MVDGMNEIQPITQPDLATYIADLKEAGYHLSSMISTILEYSRQSAGQQISEEVNVAELVTQTVHRLFPPKHIQVTVIEPMPVLLTKKVKLQQVFQNLLSNAIKYNDKAQGRVEVGGTEKGDFVEFFVRDNGPGMTSEQQTKLFRLFQPGGQSQRESSTGVGLNILKMLVDEQGGTLRVVTAPGEGCTVLFNWRK